LRSSRLQEYNVSGSWRANNGYSRFRRVQSLRNNRNRHYRTSRTFFAYFDARFSNQSYARVRATLSAALITVVAQETKRFTTACTRYSFTTNITSPRYVQSIFKGETVYKPVITAVRNTRNGRRERPDRFFKNRRNCFCTPINGDACIVSPVFFFSRYRCHGSLCRRWPPCPCSYSPDRFF